MVHILSGEIDISVICSGYELNETENKLCGINLSNWNSIIGAKVYYLDNNETNFKTIKKLISETDADIIYLNGLYSLVYVLYPLFICKIYYGKNKKLILSPRGMLQHGALKVKPFKKKVFLSLFKFLQFYKNIQWHATDEQETNDIKKFMGEKANVYLASNIAKAPVSIFQSINKKTGELKLVYLSLITEKKNLLLGLQWIKELALPLTFDIYGPVKDKKYWEECLHLIANMPTQTHVHYRGDVLPENVQNIFLNYHALFLPTSGENFGHAIYECLSVGRPAIISDNTPWKNLENQLSGFDISIQDPKKIKAAIITLFDMDTETYCKFCQNALNIAHAYWFGHNFRSSYLDMFN